jgi:hypothetical protein
MLKIVRSEASDPTLKLDGNPAIRNPDKAKRISTPDMRRGRKMVQHLWRAVGGSTLWVVCLTLLSSPSFGQGLGTGAALGGAGLLNDPFTFYYAIYLPNQQLQSLRPTPLDTINYGAMVTRQYYTQNGQRGVYDPISPYVDQNYDPLRPYSRQQGLERRARPYRFARDPSNLNGTGPSLYYGRAAGYFPTLRQGRGRNANVYTRGAGSRPTGNYFGGGGGIGGLSGGLGGVGGML